MSRNLRIFQLGLVANAVLVVAALGLLQHALKEAETTSAAVDHTVRVSTLYSELDAFVARATAAQRAFLVSAEPQSLVERDLELAQARRRVLELAGSADGDAGIASSRELKARLDALAAGFTASASLRARMSPDAPELQRARRETQAQIGAIRAAVAALADREIKLLDHSRRAQAQTFAASRMALLGTLAALALVVVGICVLFIQETRIRRKAEATAVDLAESLPGAVFRYRVNADGSARYELLSSATDALRGVDRESALRDPAVMLDTIVEGDRKALLAALANSADSMAPLLFDFRARVRDEVRWFRVQSAPRRDPDGSIVWSGHWDDITVRRELEEELLRSKEAADSANRAKSVFLATMSHEIRTPMNGVMGMLELLDMSELDADQRSTLAIIRESGRSLLRIIDDILDFSKIEAGKLDLATEPVSLRDIVERVWAMFSGMASGKGLLLTRFFDSRISPAVVADPVRLQQVLGNFVSNALKFTNAGGASIAATLLERRDGHDVVQFIVADTGIGLSSDQQALLFKPFSQIREAAAPGGTGLGLSIAKRLAGLMNGSIEMESEPGHGTRLTFAVTLQIADPEALRRHASSSREAKPAAIAHGAVQPGIVLVVDDHPINRLVLLRQVQALGHQVQTAEDGRVAFERWQAGDVHTIITDCNMPGMNGYDLAIAIREAESGSGRRRTSIIACTANVLEGEAEKCRAAGMDDYLAKPVALQRLSECLARRSAASERAGLIDQAVLDEITQGNDAFARELLVRFADSTGGDCVELRQAHLEGRLPDLAAGAHRLKGACAAIGAVKAARACADLEASARSKESTLICAALDHLERSMKDLRRQILLNPKAVA